MRNFVDSLIKISHLGNNLTISEPIVLWPLGGGQGGAYPTRVQSGTKLDLPGGVAKWPKGIL